MKINKNHNGIYSTKTTTSIAILKFNLSLLLLSFVICGCSGEVNEESAVNIESISENEENEIYDESEEVSVETENEYPNYIIADENAVELELFAEIELDEYCHVRMLLDDCIIYIKEHFTPINEKNYDYNSDEEYFVYDIKTKEHKSIGTIYNLFAGSGDILLAPDGYVYLSCQTKISAMTIYQVNPISLFKLDIENGVITDVYQDDEIAISQSIFVLDDNHLVLFDHFKKDVSAKHTYTVTLYDLYTQETKVIFDTSRISDEDKGYFGESLTDLQAYNGEIYCLMKDGDYRIDVINADGEFLRTIALDNDAIDEASSGYGIWKMIIYDDVIWFRMLRGGIVPFITSDGTAIGETLKSADFGNYNPNVERKSLLLKNKESVILFRRVEDKLVKYELNYELKRDTKRLINEYPFMSYSGDYIGIENVTGYPRNPAPTKLFLYKIIYN